MGRIRPKTSETNYQSALRNIAQELGFHLPCGGSLKSRIYNSIEFQSLQGYA